MAVTNIAHLLFHTQPTFVTAALELLPTHIIPVLFP